MSSLSYLGMFVGAASAGLLADRFGRATVSDQHDLLGARQQRLRRVIDGCYARRLASVARLRHGHGVSSRAIHGVGDDPGRAARPLHRHLEGFWPIGFIASGLLIYYRAVGRRVALSLHPPGDPRAVCAGDPPLRSDRALARLPRPSSAPNGHGRDREQVAARLAAASCPSEAAPVQPRRGPPLSPALARRPCCAVLARRPMA